MGVPIKVPLVVEGAKLGDLLSRSSRGSGYRIGSPTRVSAFQDPVKGLGSLLGGSWIVE